MSRGLGDVQQKILDALYHYRDVEHLTVVDLAMRVYRKPENALTPAQMKSIRRALQGLATRDLVRISSRTRRGRACWTRTGKDFGRAVPAPRHLTPV